MAKTADEAYRNAVERIEAALRERSKKLDLGGRRDDIAKLSKLPESLGRLTQLHSLDLTSNQLTGWRISQKR